MRGFYSCTFGTAAFRLMLNRFRSVAFGFKSFTSFNLFSLNSIMTVTVVKRDLIQIVKSYQGYPQPWYGDDLIRVASRLS